jgi:hypothetical protein
VNFGTALLPFRSTRSIPSTGWVAECWRRLALDVFDTQSEFLRGCFDFDFSLSFPTPQNSSVLHQRWPEVDADHLLKFTVMVRFKLFCHTACQHVCVA